MPTSLSVHALPREIRAVLVQAAREHDLPLEILCALVRVESGGNPLATRYEPGYAYLLDVQAGKPIRLRDRTPPSDFPHLPGAADASGLTEWMGQKTSWGGR